MKNLIIIATGLLLSAVTQVCGFGSCSTAFAQTSPLKKEVMGEPKSVKLKITGMTCAGCSNHISNALKSMNGVIKQTVEYPGNVATIKYDPSKTNVIELIKVIEKTGYKAEIIKTEISKKNLKQDEKI